MKVFLLLLSIFLLPFLLCAQNWPSEPGYDIPGGIQMGECMAVMKGSKYSLLDKELKTILPYDYSSITRVGKMIKVVRNDSTWLYSGNGKKLSDKAVKSVVEVSNDGYIVFSLWDNKFLGIMDSTGKVLLSPLFYELSYVGEGYFKSRRNIMNNYGIVDAKGRIIIGDSLSIIENITDGLAIASPAGNTMLGYLEVKTGKWVIPPNFLKAQQFLEGVAIVGDAYGNSGKSVIYGLIDKAGTMPVGYVYDFIYPFGKNGLAKVWCKISGSEKDRYGAIDVTGKLVLPCEFQLLGDFYAGHAIVKQQDKFGIIDEKGMFTVPCQYDGLISTDANSWIVLDKGKYGLIDQAGKWILPMEYEYISPTTTGFLWGKKEGKYRLLNNKGKELFITGESFIPSSFFFNDIAYIKRGSAHFLVNDKGEKLKELPYDEVGVIKDGTIAVKKGGKYGFINTEGVEILKPQNNNIIEFSEGIGAVQVGTYDPPYCIDRSGNKLFTLGQYMFTGPYSEGLAKVFVNNTYNYNAPDYRLGYADKKGNLQLSTNYKDGGNFKNGYAIVLDVLGTDSAYTLIDTTGKAFLSDLYPSISMMTPDGLAAVMSTDNLWGYTEKSGAIVIPFQYEDASDFVDGMALVKYNGKVGGINTHGKKILNFDYEAAQVLNNSNYLILKKEGKWGALDKKGKPVIEFKYDNLANFADGVAWARFKGVWGILDAKGNWKPTPEVTGARGFEHGLSVFNNDQGNTGVIDKTGKIILPASFDDVSDIIDGKLVVSQRSSYSKIPLKQ